MSPVRRSSPFEDEATLERAAAILRRGWERYLAEQNQTGGAENQRADADASDPTPEASR